jgi:hypothetical protein
MTFATYIYSKLKFPPFVQTNIFFRNRKISQFFPSLSQFHTVCVLTYRFSHINFHEILPSVSRSPK